MWVNPHKYKGELNLTQTSGGMPDIFPRLLPRSAEQDEDPEFTAKPRSGGGQAGKYPSPRFSVKSSRPAVFHVFFKKIHPKSDNPT